MKTPRHLLGLVLLLGLIAPVRSAVAVRAKSRTGATKNAQAMTIASRQASQRRITPLRSDRWATTAKELLRAIDKKSPGTFPATIAGHGLIPPSKLATLRASIEGRKEGVFDRFDSIEVQKLHEKPAIVIRYFIVGEVSPRTWVTYGSEFPLWRRHLRSGLRTTAKRLTMAEDELPFVEAKAGPDPRKTQLETNDFRIARSFEEYREDLPGLGAILPPLRRSGARWIDMGAGGAFAHRQYLTGLKRTGARGETIPELLALGYVMPDGRLGEDIKRRAATSGGKFRYVEGKQGPTSIRRLPKADLITDVMGIFTYSTSPKVDLLAAYVDRLRHGGHALISTYSFDARVMRWLDIQKARGRIDYAMVGWSGSLQLRKLVDD